MKVGDWQVRTDSVGGFDLVCSTSSVTLQKCRPSVRCGPAEYTPSAAPRCGGQMLTCELSGPMTLELAFSSVDAVWLMMTARLTNTGLTAVAIDEVSLLSCQDIQSPAVFDRVLPNSKDMCGQCWLDKKDGRYTSSCVCGLASSDGAGALAAGFIDLSKAFYRFDMDKADGRISLNAVCQREGIVLAAGQTLALSPMVIGSGPSLSALMDGYAAQTAAVMGYRDTPTATGWCSWYYYYDTATESDIDRNMDAIAASPLKDDLRVIQIDDGWNLPAKDAPRVWGDWVAGSMFPNGMKELADRIKRKGFVPGLWLAPFSVDPASRVYKEHPDWLVQDNGKPKDFWGVSALDLSRPQAIAFVEETFERVFNQWGFDYIKIDFLLHAVMLGERFDRTRTTAQLLREGLQAIRRIAKDRFILCCGCPVGPAVGTCDGMRVGYDVSSRWDVRVNPNDWPMGNLNIRAAALQSGWRQWMHRRWWQNDPDCLVVRDYGSKPEIKTFATHFPEFKDTPPYGLSDTEAQCWSQFVWFTGGMALVSENMDELHGTRRELLTHNFPPHSDPVRWADWYQEPDVFVMQSLGKTKKVGLFNFSNEPAAVSLSAEKLSVGSEWTFTERLSGQRFSGAGVTVEFPVLPPHCGRVWIQQTS